MQIKLSPIRSDSALAVHMAGDILTVNGVAYDFGPLPDGAILPRDAVACPWLASDVARLDGEIVLTLRLPHGPNAPEETRFPQPIIVSQDGPIALPPFDTAPEGDLPGDMIGEFDE